MPYLGNQPLGGQQQVQYLSGDGSTTTFALSYATGAEASVLVFISGVKQQASTYSLMNGNINFTTAPPTGTNNIELIYLGGAVLSTPYLSADTYGIIRINANTITQNCTITTGYNGSSAGPLTIANNVTITIANNATWHII